MVVKSRLISSTGQVISKRFNSTITNDISSQLSNIPKSTGAGPFIEYPRFEPLGNPASLINITLPPSSVLNLRTNSILAANGDLNNISSKLSILKLFTNPLIYNKISSTTPLSLILSNKGSNKFFVNLELSELEEWTIFNTKNLIAWYGPDLKITNNNKIGINLSSGNNKSNVILNGETQLFTLNLEQDETLYLNPKSIIAINSSQSGSNFHKLDSSSLQLSIPKFKIWDSIKIAFNSLYSKFNQYIQVPSETKAIETTKSITTENKSSTSFEIPQSLKSFGTWISTKFNNFILNDKVFYEVKGPATIIVQNSTSISTSKIFTNEQLNEIYQNLK